MNTLDARRRILGRNVYKKTVEGNPAIAQGSLARRYPGITMQGWTEQAQYEGNQLFDVEAAKNPDNYIEGSFGYWGMEIPAKSGNKYTFNRNLTNGYGLELGSAGLKNDNQGTATFLVDSARENLNVSVISITAAQDKIYFVTNQRDPEKLKQLIETCFENPMINEGSIALPWEPYTGGQPSPNPDYPQEIKNAGKYDEGTGKYQYTIKISDSEESPTKSQTVTLTADRPLTKWDKLEKRNGQWGWVYKSAEIESYTDESVPGEYYSTTGQLSVGAQVWYETATKTFVPLSESEQEQMNALYTFRPTTVLSNDCECEMSLTYKTKKSLEVTT